MINSIKVYEQLAKIVPLTKYSTRILYQQKFQNLPSLSITFNNIVTGIIQEDINIIEEQFNNHKKFLKKYDINVNNQNEYDPNKINSFDWNNVCEMDKLPYYWHNVWLPNNYDKMPWF